MSIVDVPKYVLWYIMESCRIKDIVNLNCTNRYFKNKTDELITIYKNLYNNIYLLDENFYKNIDYRLYNSGLIELRFNVYKIICLNYLNFDVYSVQYRSFSQVLNNIINYSTIQLFKKIKPYLDVIISINLAKGEKINDKYAILLFNLNKPVDQYIDINTLSDNCKKWCIF